MNPLPRPQSAVAPKSWSGPGTDLESEIVGRGGGIVARYLINSMNEPIFRDGIVHEDLRPIKGDDAAPHRDPHAASCEGREDEAVLEDRGVCRVVDQDVSLHERGELSTRPAAVASEGTIDGRQDSDGGSRVQVSQEAALLEQAPELTDAEGREGVGDGLWEREGSVFGVAGLISDALTRSGAWPADGTGDEPVNGTDDALVKKDIVGHDVYGGPTAGDHGRSRSWSRAPLDNDLIPSWAEIHEFGVINEGHLSIASRRHIPSGLGTLVKG
ncbi:hypothetical protein RRF57_008827 [Xylaria bambusicola]|uniref:Uncharacterized protein n=1 Tax=Xylaria bambusicola TaxID=326684 RepID=A0AAN7ZBM8_9PEZI